MRWSRAGRPSSEMRGADVDEPAILSSQDLAKVLIEVQIELLHFVWIGPSDLQLLVPCEQEAKCINLVAAAPKDGYEASGGDHRTTQRLSVLQAFWKYQTRNQETKGDYSN